MLRSAVVAMVWVPLAIAQSASDPADRRASSATAGVTGLLDRILGMVGPAESTQLTEKERFQQYVLYTVGPVPLIGQAAGAGIGQWAGRPREWGQGWGAYGQRYGSDLAYNAVRQTISYGTSVVFHEDGRYFASVKHGFWPRTRHALLSTISARHPDGRQTFSVSSVTGVVGAATISSIWVREVGRARETSRVMPASPSPPQPVLMLRENSCRISCSALESSTAFRSNAGVEFEAI